MQQATQNQQTRKQAVIAKLLAKSSLQVSCCGACKGGGGGKTIG
jgi:hypothetical protein